MFASTFAVLALLASPDLVEGHGENAAAAWARAAEAAQDRVRELLPPAFRAASWGCDAPALSPDLLTRTGVLTPDGDPTPSAVVDGRRLVAARYRVTLTPEYLTEARRLLRADLTRDRQILLGKALAGVITLLLVACAYMRLEEWTRGYATRLLQAVALAALALAALALWLVG